MNNKKYTFISALFIALIAEAIMQFLISIIPFIIIPYIMITADILFSVLIYGKWMPSCLKTVNVKKNTIIMVLTLIAIALVQIVFTLLLEKETGIYTTFVNPMLYYIQLYIINREMINFNTVFSYALIVISFVSAISLKPLCLAIGLKKKQKSN